MYCIIKCDLLILKKDVSHASFSFICRTFKAFKEYKFLLKRFSFMTLKFVSPLFIQKVTKTKKITLTHLRI